MVECPDGSKLIPGNVSESDQEVVTVQRLGQWEIVMYCFGQPPKSRKHKDYTSQSRKSLLDESNHIDLIICKFLHLDICRMISDIFTATTACLLIFYNILLIVCFPYVPVTFTMKYIFSSQIIYETYLRSQSKKKFIFTLIIYLNAFNSLQLTLYLRLVLNCESPASDFIVSESIRLHNQA